MRIKTKNRGIITVTVVLLMLAAMFVTGCDNVIIVEKPYTPPAGMGSIKLNFNPNVERTILPEGITAESFEKFVLIFTPDGGSPLGDITVFPDKIKVIQLI